MTADACSFPLVALLLCIERRNAMTKFSAYSTLGRVRERWHRRAAQPQVDLRTGGMPAERALSHRAGRWAQSDRSAASQL